MNTFSDFALEEEYKRLQSVGDKVVEIDSLIDWKSFLIIFESMFFNKKVFKDRHETKVIIMCKVLFYSNCIVFTTLNLRKNELLRFLSENVLVFLSIF